MLARSQKIVHKTTGNFLYTPLLIPSFSSKGFTQNSNGEFEINSILKFSSEFITETCLISAYDIYYKHISSPKDLPLNLNIIFLDSGGYEISKDDDFSATVQSRPKKDKWGLQMYETVLATWPSEVPAVFVNYDHPQIRKPFKEQVKDARILFRPYENQLHLFLLKPETKDQTTLKEALKSVQADIDNLGLFDIIGVTEKELGSSMIERMTQIGKLRKTMDDAGIKNPIHIFGALDPIAVGLYFIAGAEIFDGLTWIRFAYDNGRCIYIYNRGALNYGLDTKDSQVKRRSMTDNIYELYKFERALRDYITTRNFSKFSPHDDFIKNAIDTLETELKGGVL